MNTHEGCTWGLLVSILVRWTWKNNIKVQYFGFGSERRTHIQGKTRVRNIFKGVLLCIVVNNGVFDQFKSQEDHSTLVTKNKLIFPSSPTSCKNDLYSEWLKWNVNHFLCKELCCSEIIVRFFPYVSLDFFFCCWVVLRGNRRLTWRTMHVRYSLGVSDQVAWSCSVHKSMLVTLSRA